MKAAINNYSQVDFTNKSESLKINFLYRKIESALLVILFFFVINQKAFSQGVGISSTSITPDASSVLEVRSTTQGMLIPRMTTTERNGIASPASGLMIYNTTTNQFNYYDGSWKIITSGASATAGKILVSDGTSFVASTPTYPNASVTAGKIMVSDGTNFVASTPTYPNASATAGKILVSDGTNFVASTPTYPNASATSGKIVISNGTNFVASTPTYPNASATSGKILVSDGTNFVASTPTYPNASATSGKIVISDGTNFISSTPTFPNAAGTAGNSLRSDGTNFVSTAVTESQSTVAAPTGTTNATGVMMGLAGAITPIRSGKILIIISGDMSSSTAGDGVQVQIRYGTGTAPVNGAALTGTAVGGLVKLFGVRTASWDYPFSLNAIVTGLTAATAYWVDVSAARITGGTASIADVSISIVEL